MLDCYSSIGNNQWMSKQSHKANLIKDSTLEDFSEWDFRQDDPPNPDKDPISRITTPFAEGTKEVTRFEVRQGQVHTIISQQVDMSLGEVYHVLTHGKAYEATFDVRIARGRLGQIYEYSFIYRKYRYRGHNRRYLSILYWHFIDSIPWE